MADDKGALTRRRFMAAASAASVTAAGGLALCCPAGAQAAEWGYAGARGPAHWASLSPRYRACEGSNQSPIDLTGFVEAGLAPLRFDYRAGGQRIVNNGHTVMLPWAQGSAIALGRRRFALLQLHFHTPSEHRIDGKAFAMEAHFVHVDDGEMAVVAVMLEQGKANPALAAMEEALPQRAGDMRTLPAPIAATGLLPAGRGYYYVNGSLTTPPCTEGVRWLVMKQPLQASKRQLEAFARAMGGPNNRPLQPTGARLVLQ